MSRFTIGCDAEVMLEKNGKLISAVGILPSSEEPLELPYGHIFYDNVLAEFTIEPAKTKKSFVKHITENLKAVKAMFTKQGFSIRILPSANYPKKELLSDAAREFGCSPDFDAYSLTVNKPSVDASETTLRSAGAHVHVGNDIFEDPLKIIEGVKMMDLYLGLPSLEMDNSEAAKNRRQLYGKAGAHRPKDYPGLEYRSLSNFWIAKKDTIEWVYEQTGKMVKDIINGQTIESMGVKGETLQAKING